MVLEHANGLTGETYAPIASSLAASGVERIGQATTLRTQRDSTHVDALANPERAAQVVQGMHWAQTLEHVLALGQGLGLAEGSGGSGDIGV